MSETQPTTVPGEGHVVTEGGQRVDGRVHKSVAEAEAAAATLAKKLQEQSGNPAPKVEVKRQLFG